MGNDESAPVSDGPPTVLTSKDIKGIAKYMKSPECKKVFVMAGAGISTSAGIPDFRSPGTGLYDNLARLNLPYAEAVFAIDYFRKNPLPFYALAKDMDPSQFRPTPTHSFFRLLHAKGLLSMCFTQNIDTLERRAGLPGHKIVEAHGSFASNSCIDCSEVFPMEEMKVAVAKGEPARCGECGGLVKPDIVFFGEGMPESFFRTVPQLRTADLLFVLGTSLTVMPFAGICRYAPLSCPRVLINLDPVGDIGSRPEDVLALGHCDAIVRELCAELGWAEELEALWAETEGLGQKVDEKDELDRVVRDIEQKLKISEAVEEVVGEKVGEEGKEEGTGMSKPVEEGAAKALGEHEKTPVLSDPKVPELSEKQTSPPPGGAAAPNESVEEKDEAGEVDTKKSPL